MDFINRVKKKRTKKNPKNKRILCGHFLVPLKNISMSCYTCSTIKAMTFYLFASILSVCMCLLSARSCKIFEKSLMGKVLNNMLKVENTSVWIVQFSPCLRACCFLYHTLTLHLSFELSYVKLWLWLWSAFS